MKLPEGVLAYFLLNSANVPDVKKEICRATCPALTYDRMRQTIKKVGVDTVIIIISPVLIRVQSPSRRWPDLPQ